jgi:lysozyme
MGNIMAKLGMTTDKGMNYQGVLFLSMAIILDMDQSSPWRNYLMAGTLICLALVAFFTQGHIAEPGPMVPDVPPDEGDIDLHEDLSSVLEKGRQFAAMPLSLVSSRLPVGISQNGIDLIKEFEGFRAKAYLCPARVWTLGYGHTVGVKPGMTVTKAEAEAMLRKDLKIYERHVANALGDTKTSQGQWDALVSFCFNAGPGNLLKSSMLRLHKQGQYKAAADAFLNWTKGGGRVLPGLVRRRKSERALYLS